MPHTKRKIQSPVRLVLDLAAALLVDSVKKSVEPSEPIGPDVLLRRYKDARDTLVFARQRAAAGIRDPEMPVSKALNLWRQAKRDATEVLRDQRDGRIESGGCVYHLHTEYDGDGRVAAYGVSVHRKMRRTLEGTAPFLVNGWRRHGVNE